MGQPEESIAVLQRFVDSYADDIRTVSSAASDPSTPEAARRLLVGALNYGLDALDIFPDHYRGLGVADDALVLRLASAQAIGAGASHPGVRQLAQSMPEVRQVFGDLTEPLERFVARLPEREVRGRTAQQVLGSGDTRVLFEADVARQVKSYTPHKIDVSGTGAAFALKELMLMARASLKKAGIV